MSKIWEDLKTYVKQGATAVAEKTEELSKVGKIKIDIMGIERNLQKTLSELGGQVYHLAADDKKAKLLDDEKVQEIIEKVKDFETQLEEKKQELEEVGKEKAEAEVAETDDVVVEEPTVELDPDKKAK